MSTYPQNPVSKAIWPWTRNPEKNPPGLGRRLQTPGLWIEVVVNVVVALLVGYLLVYRRWGKETLGCVVMGVAGVILLSAVFLPSVHAGIKRGFGWFGNKVGIGLGWLLLPPFYYLVIFPGRLLLALRGKDPMARSFPTDEPTYWIPRKPIEDSKHYTRQH